MQSRTALALFLACTWTDAASAQGRGATDWTTNGSDAQRSFWVRTDPKISQASMEKPGFALAWKIRFSNEAKQLNSLTPAVLLDRYIGYRGFRSLAFSGGSSDNVFAVDTDLGRVEWKMHFGGGKSSAGTPECPGGMTANVTRPTAFAMTPPPSGRSGAPGRSGPARSGVGKPDEGAVTLSGAGAPRMVFAAPVLPPRGPVRPGPAAGGGRMASVLYVLSSDGMLHTMYVSNGQEPEAPIRFLPANANADGLIVVDGVAYVTTVNGCGGVANGLWALDLTTKQVASWKTPGSGTAGPAFGPDGTIYVTAGSGDAAHSVVALEPGTLQLKDWYKASGEAITSSPVIFQYKEKVLLAAASKDGRIHLLDSAKLGGTGHETALYKTAALGTGLGGRWLASWQDSGGGDWVLTPTANAVVALKVTGEPESPSLQQGWVSREMTSPLTPMIINGVVFALASGELKRSPAVLYALDGTTGKELWSSGKTMTSFVHNGGLSGGGSQLYVGTYDGTLYAFGFPIEH